MDLCVTLDIQSLRNRLPAVEGEPGDFWPTETSSALPESDGREDEDLWMVPW